MKYEISKKNNNNKKNSMSSKENVEEEKESAIERQLDYLKWFTNKRRSDESERKRTALSDRAEAYSSSAVPSSSLSKTTTSAGLLLGFVVGGFDSEETRR